MSYPIRLRASDIPVHENRFALLEERSAPTAAARDKPAQRAKVQPSPVTELDSHSSSGAIDLYKHHGFKLYGSNISGSIAEIVFGSSTQLVKEHDYLYPYRAITELLAVLHGAGIGEEASPHDRTSATGNEIWADGFQAPFKHADVSHANVYLVGPARGLDHLVDQTLDREVIPRFYAAVSAAEPPPAAASPKIGLVPVIATGVVALGFLACGLKKVFEGFTCACPTRERAPRPVAASVELGEADELGGDRDGDATAVVIHPLADGASDQRVVIGETR